MSNLIIRGCKKGFETAAVGSRYKEAVEDPNTEEHPGGVGAHRVPFPGITLSYHGGKDEPDAAVDSVPGLEVLADDLN